MECCRPHSLPLECYEGTKRDHIKIYQIEKDQVYILEAHQINCISIHCNYYSDGLFVFYI